MACTQQLWSLLMKRSKVPALVLYLQKDFIPQSPNDWKAQIKNTL